MKSNPSLTIVLYGVLHGSQQCLLVGKFVDLSLYIEFALLQFMEYMQMFSFVAVNLFIVYKVNYIHTIMISYIFKSSRVLHSCQ